MTFDEFLTYVRKEIGLYCKEAYLRNIYETRIKGKTAEEVKLEMACLAVNAIATDYSTKRGQYARRY